MIAFSSPVRNAAASNTWSLVVVLEMIDKDGDNLVINMVLIDLSVSSFMCIRTRIMVDISKKKLLSMNIILFRNMDAAKYDWIYAVVPT